MASVQVKVYPTSNYLNRRRTKLSAERSSGFLKRVLAGVVDAISVVAASLVLVFVASWAIIRILGLDADESRSLGYAYGYAFPFVVAAMQWLYSSILEATHRQATLGKRLMKIKVCDSENHPLTFLRSAARNALKIISISVFFLGYITVFFTKRKQALHDLLCGCTVIRQISQDHS